MSSGQRISMRERGGLGIGLAGLQAVIETAEEAVEQIALRGSMSITGQPAAVVVSASTRREPQRGEGPELADCGQTIVLHGSMECNLRSYVAQLLSGM